MKAPWRDSSYALPWLTLIALALLLVVLFKEGYITWALLSVHKDEIGVTADVIQAIILVIGSIFAYMKFFKGRTLRAKLVIKPACTIVKIDKGLHHWIDIEIQNTGSVSIWNYKVRALATLHGKKEQAVEIHDFVSLPSEIRSEEHLIDVGESSYEQAHCIVPEEISAVTYQILVTDHKGTVWDRAVTVKNVEPSAK